MLFLTLFLSFCLFFFFKQKTAYEMRISDWSSDVCSSDLIEWVPEVSALRASPGDDGSGGGVVLCRDLGRTVTAALIASLPRHRPLQRRFQQDRKSVV